MEDEIDKEFIIADPNAESEIKQPIIGNIPDDDLCETTKKLIQVENLIEVKTSPNKIFRKGERNWSKNIWRKIKNFANAREITEEKEQNQIINFHPDKAQALVQTNNQNMKENESIQKESSLQQVETSNIKASANQFEEDQTKKIKKLNPNALKGLDQKQDKAHNLQEFEMES